MKFANGHFTKACWLFFSKLVHVLPSWKLGMIKHPCFWHWGWDQWSTCNAYFHLKHSLNHFYCSDEVQIYPCIATYSPRFLRETPCEGFVYMHFTLQILMHDQYDCEYWIWTPSSNSFQIKQWLYFWLHNCDALEHIDEITPHWFLSEIGPNGILNTTDDVIRANVAPALFATAIISQTAAHRRQVKIGNGPHCILSCAPLS